MKKVLVILVVSLSSMVSIAQSDGSLHASQFPGPDVGTKVANAQAACNPNTAIPCFIILDGSLAVWPAGTLPTKCGNCYWLDYRAGLPSGGGGTVGITGAIVPGDCTSWADATHIQDAGPCGTGGTGGGPGGNGTLTAPTFAPAAGSYSGGQTVSLVAASGATVCYTLDGSSPAASTPGTCSHGSTYSGPLNISSTATVDALATQYAWTNSSVATSAYTISFPVYTDSFVRANGGLGANWAEPNGAIAALTINSDLVYAASVPTVHAFEVYIGGAFSNNQWSELTVESGQGAATTDSGQGIVVRGDPAGSGFYNDAVATGAGMGGLTYYRIGNAASMDFCTSEQMGTPYAIGDTHMLAVAGTGPVFFWSLHGVGSGTPTMDATCFDIANNITGGEPGLGDLDGNGTATVAAGAWQGGSLPSFSTISSDNFTRANAGWLGVNWWFPESNGASPSGFFFLNSNAAKITPTGVAALAIWTTPIGANQSSVVSVGSIQPADWIGAVARYSLATNGNTHNETAYVAIDAGGAIDLFEYNGGVYTSIATMGTLSGVLNTIELDATGTSSVALVVKINGVQFGSTVNDTTYALTGTYSGFGAYGSDSSRVTGWTGAPL